MQERDREISQLRRRIAGLTEEARKNEDAWKSNQRREMQLLEAETLASLFGFLTDGLRESYELDATTLFVVDADHKIRHLLIDQGGRPEALGAVFFVDSLEHLVPPAAIRKPWLGSFTPADHGALFPGAPGLRSVALLPLMRHGAAVGSLNMGSAQADRFTVRHASDFLQHLAAIGAYCLENTVNRARLLRTGFRDVLTGWHNRRYLQIRLEEELARSKRDGAPLVALMIDVDHFKRINDTYGHLVGDEVLRRIADRIGAAVRASDVSARYGGEEFVVLLPATDIEVGFALAERIREAVSGRQFAVPGPSGALTLTVSIGVARHRPFGKGPEDPKQAGEELIAAADLALYEAKAAGRNKVSMQAPA